MAQWYSFSRTCRNWITGRSQEVSRKVSRKVSRLITRLIVRLSEGAESGVDELKNVAGNLQRASRIDLVVDIMRHAAGQAGRISGRVMVLVEQHRDGFDHVKGLVELHGVFTEVCEGVTPDMVCSASKEIAGNRFLSHLLTEEAGQRVEAA